MKSIVVKILNILARRILAKYNPIVIGITGSVGKSSARKAIYEILRKKYKVACNKSSYQTDISIPLAVIGLESGGRSVKNWLRIIKRALNMIFNRIEYPEILVLEMGVDRPGDMKKMLKVVRPGIGVFMEVGKFPSHIAYFRDARHIAREKYLLIKSLGKKNLAVLNYDDEFVKEFISDTRSKIASYGFDESSDFKAEEILSGEKKWKIGNGLIGMSFKISHKGTTVPFRLPYALGRGQIYAALSAAAVGTHFGFNLLEISEILSSYQPLPGRMKLMKGAKNSLIIDDSFNANPDSTLAALETLRKLDARRKIAILGDMLELGEASEEGHMKVGENVPASADYLFTFGRNAKAIFNSAHKKGMANDKIFHFENMADLVMSLKDIIQAEDVVLIKGSRAMHMERIVKEIMAEPEKAGELLVNR